MVLNYFFVFKQLNAKCLQSKTLRRSANGSSFSLAPFGHLQDIIPYRYKFFNPDFPFLHKTFRMGNNKIG